MKPYHKIQTIYKRDPDTKRLVEGQFSLPVFEYLANNTWVFDEKIDGTNIRIHWDGEQVSVGGRTDNAQIPAKLLNRLQYLFPAEKFQSLYPDTPMTLYGEGYGLKIQKVGAFYLNEGVDFILFDVTVADTWLERGGVEDIADKLGIETTPVVGEGTLYEAVEAVREGFDSRVSEKPLTAEGVIVRPKARLYDERGNRVIAKIKHHDFNPN